MSESQNGSEIPTVLSDNRVRFSDINLFLFFPPENFLLSKSVPPSMERLRKIYKFVSVADKSDSPCIAVNERKKEKVLNYMI